MISSILFLSISEFLNTSSIGFLHKSNISLHNSSNLALVNIRLKSFSFASDSICLAPKSKWDQDKYNLINK